jgi:hypothetical protein
MCVLCSKIYDRRVNEMLLSTEKDLRLAAIRDCTLFNALKRNWQLSSFIIGIYFHSSIYTSILIGVFYCSGYRKN